MLQGALANADTYAYARDTITLFYAAPGKRAASDPYSQTHSPDRTFRAESGADNMGRNYLCRRRVAPRREVGLLVECNGQLVRYSG